MLTELFPERTSVVEIPRAIEGHLQRVFADEELNDGGSVHFEISRQGQRITFEIRQLDPLTYKLTGTLPDRRDDRGRLAGIADSPEELTKRELDVLGWALEGKTTPEIAILLGIRLKTVESHLRAIYGKLGVHSRGELMRARAGN